jgi:hypothetical protein
LTTTVTSNLTTISLTAGDWDIYSTTQFLPNSGNLTSGLAGISNASATFIGPSADGFPQAKVTSGTGQDGEEILSVVWRLNITTTTTVYAIAYGVFSGTCTSQGSIWARRRR